MIFSKNKSTQSFTLPLLFPVLIGLGITTLFYVLILTGPLNYYLLRRYCLCHEVAVVTVGLFWISATALTMKLIQIHQQRGLLKLASEQLESLIVSAPDTSTEGPAYWLELMWQSSPTSIWKSFFGQRVSDILLRQVKRGNSKGLDEDLRELADRDANRQHESYGLIRIAIWAMPMLGFLGTVIGIAGTLGQIDSEMLASGSQEAMNTITAGLYVAFDKTAIALALTMVAMFMQFGVQRIEFGLLAQIDELVSDQLIEFLSEDTGPAFSEPTHELIEKLTNKLASVVSDVVQQQATLWRSTIDEAHQHWERVSVESEATLQNSLVTAIDRALEKHAQYLIQSEASGAAQIDARWQQWQTTLSEQTRMILQLQSEQADQALLWRSAIQEAHQHWQQIATQSESTLQDSLIASIDKALDKHAKYLERAESLGTAQIDARWQQWQTTLSEQARMILTFQREQTDQVEMLQELLEKTGELNQLEQSLDRNILRLTDVDRFHKAAVCMTEAVAFMATHMEKQGAFAKGVARKIPMEPRIAPETRTTESLSTEPRSPETRDVAPRVRGRAA